MSQNKVLLLLAHLSLCMVIVGAENANPRKGRPDLQCAATLHKPNCTRFWKAVLLRDVDEQIVKTNWMKGIKGCFHDMPIDLSEPLQLEMTPTKMQVRLVDEKMQEITLQKEVDLTFTDQRFKMVKDCFPETTDFDVSIVTFRQLMGFDGLSPGKNVELIRTPDLLLQSNTDICHLSTLSGAVQCTNRITAKIMDDMQFEWFPFDDQTLVGEFDLPIDESKMNSKVIQPEDMDIGDLVPHWSIKMKLKLDSPRKKAKDGQIGYFTTVRQEIRLSRKLTMHVLQTFVPSGMLCIASAASVFIPWHLIPGRMGVCITTFLSLISLFNGAREKWIDASTLRAIDVWTILCYIIVFSSLMEYCIVLYLTKGEIYNQANFNKVNSGKGKSSKSKNVRKALFLEKTCRVMFPTYIFVSFAFYFMICLLRK